MKKAIDFMKGHYLFFAILGGFVILCGFILLIVMLDAKIRRPKATDLLRYANDTYQKEFVLIKPFSYTDHTDGSEPKPIEDCPAVELEDPATQIHFNVYARHFFDDWTFWDTYSKEVLIYCAEEQGLEVMNGRMNPHFLLTNDKDTAQKLQKVTIRYNEICTVKTQQDFTVNDSIFIFCILGGFTKDRWLDKTDLFCFDTPIEKYEVFLEEVAN